VLAKFGALLVAILDRVAEMLASLAALRAKVMGFDGVVPGVALADSGNPGLISATPLVSSE
jgi:hypothetical protein